MSSPSKTDFGPFNYVRRWDEWRSERGFWHSFELPDGKLIRGANPLEGQKRRLAQFPIPDRLDGKRVLDIGAWDGWFSFEMERRGADVMAIDCWDNPRFHEIHEILRSRVDYRQLDVYELTPERIGRFDIVLFLGVLYHLKHPLLALERVCALTTDLAAVDSFILREEHRPGTAVDQRPVMEFYETDEFGGQTDNWVGPSLPCLLAFCRTAGFARVEWRSTLEHSACIACHRRWEEPETAGESPVLRDVFHHTNFGINFRSDADDYLVVSFESQAKRLGIGDVKPEAGGFGVRPIEVARRDEQWQAKFKLPPGLKSGWQDVTVRTGSSGRSGALRIAADMPAPVDTLVIGSVCDGKTWKPNEIDLNQGDSIAIWIAGLPENADKNNVRAFLDGKRIAVLYVEPPKAKDARQVNAALPSGVPPGMREVTVSLGTVVSDPASVRVIG
ncbi:MAG: methyltransferase domain-containing protein [Bryobacteraceae bacterium]